MSTPKRRSIETPAARTKRLAKFKSPALVPAPIENDYDLKIVTTRLPPKLLKRLDAYSTAEHAERRGWGSPNRSDAFRRCIEAGLEVLEPKVGIKKAVTK